MTFEAEEQSQKPGYPCQGCGEPIVEGPVILAGTNHHYDSKIIILHAGELEKGGRFEVANQIKRDRENNTLESCAAKYMSDDGRSLINPRVLNFSGIDSAVIDFHFNHGLL
jgi:hypothetical protein